MNVKIIVLGALLVAGLILITEKTGGQVIEEPESLTIDPMTCAPYDPMVKSIWRLHGETSVVILPTHSKSFIEIFLNEDTGTWTLVRIVLVGRNKIACPRDFGTDGVMTR